MKRGQASLSAGLLGALQPDGALSALSLRTEIPLSKKLGLTGSAGVFANTEGTFSPRDLQVGLPHLLVNRPTLLFRMTPGFSVPLGSVASGLNYTLLTTGSFDPTLALDLTVGSGWLGLFSVTGRAPVYAGFDRIRQGVYGRADARIARRLSGGAVFGGLSFAAQQTRGLTSPGFTELAAIAGATTPLSTTWGGSISARVPLVAQTSRYLFALRIGLTRVVGKARAVPQHDG